MKSLQQEILTSVSVLAFPAAIVLSFPSEAVSFRAKPVSPDCAASAAFVTLSPEQERAALAAAKTAWQSDAATRQRQRIRLPLGELPEDAPGPLLDIGAGLRPVDVPEPFGYRPLGWEPSLRSASPARIPSERPSGPVPAFSREELLKMN